ncbi:M14 metallopeptidase family protein [Flavihumibacter sp. CACIAM 22H1]|uniref:M14 metallopeptidase family protein n=1 Tax=Flavihumibacter sp. CACIAM 22H1 TaxID=1812911 RepID=UPI0007A892BC|nr:M14 metallopeptidase family protein [Flavihumibacter sp. CACIAM 22H1]KYP14310.1 MAG: zinc carboxypeptidase [Flavihumibacter sp. CACIAM 22H1]
MKKIIFVFWVLAGFVGQSQELAYYLPAAQTYNPAVPKPEAVIGHKVGEWHITHDRLVLYMKALAAAVPDRIQLQVMGTSYEARQQVLLTITSPENHRNLPSIREEHRKLSDPGFTGNLTYEQMPAVVYQGFSIHGNEPSGANAALLTAYHLAAATGPAIDSLLKEVVILLDPSFNPDGLNRFATWANMHRSANLVTDPASREFNEVWPGGRYNHYWFDLNRDWLPAQHRESQHRLKIYQQWRPNILTDHHEMGTDATFFFQPGEPSRVNPLTPVKNQELTQAIANFHANYLDKIGSLYYTKEGYDDFYYGKGSTYPDAQGCIGILFEQASSRGHAQQSINGVLTFPFTIRNQFTTTLSTLAAARAMRIELLQYQRSFYQQMAKDAKAAAVKGWIFGNEADEARTGIFVEMLQRHEINVERLEQDIAIGKEKFKKGSSYLVRTEQPQYKLIQTFFEKIPTYKDSLFYDITAWTMTMAMGLKNSALTAAQLAAVKAAPITAWQSSKGQLLADSSAYAYVFEWSEYYAPRMLNSLLKQGVVMRVATKTFTATVNGQPKNFPLGSLLIPVQLQTKSSSELLSLLKEEARLNGINVEGISTGMSVGGVDLGSRSLQPVLLPSIALLVGAGVSALDAGEVWHLLDQRFAMPPSMLEAPVFNRINLSGYTTMVLVGGSYSAFQTEKLKTWVQAGGTLILTEDAIEWAKQAGLVKLEFKKTAPVLDSSKQYPYAQRSAIVGAQQVRGAILQAQADQTHPLAYGYEQDFMYLFKQNNVFMKLPANPFAAPIQYGSQPLASGFITQQNLDVIKKSAAVLVQTSGNGRIICIGDNPNFRAYWLGGSKLFMNAVFFGRLIEAGSATAEEE